MYLKSYTAAVYKYSNMVLYIKYNNFNLIIKIICVLCYT